MEVEKEDAHVNGSTIDDFLRTWNKRCNLDLQHNPSLSQCLIEPCHTHTPKY